MNIWAELEVSSTTTPENILSQTLWFNEFIKINHKTIFIKNLSDIGIYYINDIVDQNGHILNYERFTNAYGFALIDFMSYNSLIRRVMSLF